VSDGLSSTAVEFRMEVPTDQAVQDVKDAIDGIVGDLPGDVETPVVTRVDVEGQAIMTFAVSAPDMSLEELSWFVDDTITRALQGRPGVGRIDRYGGADREILIGSTLAARRLRDHAAPLSADPPTNSNRRRPAIWRRRAGDPLLGDQGDASGLAHDHRAALGPQCGRRLGTVPDTSRSCAPSPGRREAGSLRVFRAKGGRGQRPDG
jgi:hypothetical protein